MDRVDYIKVICKFILCSLALLTYLWYYFL